MESAQTLAATAVESFTSMATGLQEGIEERFSDNLPQNVTLMWWGGKETNVTIPWRGIGVYAGGIVSGVGLAFALLTLPYGEIGSSGLRKSLTLFENVLLDIDQVRCW